MGFSDLSGDPRRAASFGATNGEKRDENHPYEFSCKFLCDLGGVSTGLALAQPAYRQPTKSLER